VEAVARGLSNEQVARELCLSRHTVKGHMFRIGDKIGVRSRAGIVGECYRRGWLASRARIER
jgi:DNA-binding NarL/FixJ family response regulator